MKYSMNNVFLDKIIISLKITSFSNIYANV